MSRPRSIRPRKTPRSQQLTAVLRLLGRPEAGLLEAALEPKEAQAIQDRAKDEPSDSLVATAISACLEAHEAWQRMSAQQRAHVRGFSLALLGLAADQTLSLERAIEEHSTLAKEHEVAVTRLRELVPRCTLLCAQAARVLESVAGETESPEEEPVTVAGTGTFALAQTLTRLAHAGQELLRSSNGAVRKRALLYGLNEAFLEGLAAAGAELVRVSERASGTAALQNSERALDRARRATFLLVVQMGDAFDTAHRIDATVPALASVAARAKRFEAREARDPRDARNGHDARNGRDAGDAVDAKKTLELAPVRDAHVVVLDVEAPKFATQISHYARPGTRIIAPRPAPRVLDASDFGASGMIRKRSKPPLK